ncbi:hypothetical protein PM398_gp50 [Pseudomonas phage Epa40]|uniref:DNA (cytosine-5-)-methyltransferase n=1 Tax=Pseudomonas phage Epa40 TaxID=2719198 RepID=A0A6G9LKT8_9CAUD|nr:hypothetical protein PM398_gp50 [Pseudomonas phage Epa40]QIQ66017.1 hypothetical protein 40_00050 [Pseudomonas phage Epa40]QIQ66067.1 hypothetical protein 41_00002 [Pseudomonas phage Epa41]
MTKGASKMRVLSLFDGISCGRLALDRAGIKVTRYVASEIDKYAIGVSMANWKDIERRGAVQDLNFEENEFDLLIGGSPCQGLSRANNERLNLQDERSALFYEYIRIKNKVKPKYFLLENVVCDKQTEEIISEEMGVRPVLINSSLVSAQNRERLYWTNIPFEMPEDKGIVLQDILDKGRQAKGRNKSYCIVSTFYKENIKSILQRNKHGLYCFDENDKPSKLNVEECERLQTLPTGYTKSVSQMRRYAAIGNGWTVDVITHILKGIEK